MAIKYAHLLYDSISRNTGDIAIGIAGAQVLESFDVPSQIVDPLEATLPSPLIIGGGELIRESGDPFYDAFRQRGEHILNAAGVWHAADDLDYLNAYSFVSARSTREAEILSASVANVEVLPCATTILSSDDYVIEGVEPGEPVVGIHMVPHSFRLIEDLVETIDAIAHKKVFIPFTHYNGDASFMNALPFDRSNSIFLDRLNPLQLHSVIRQMRYVVVSSLHASIFAYSQNVPFVGVHQRKAEDYFVDRGLGSNLVRSRADLVEQLERVEAEPEDYTERIAKDRDAILTAFRGYAERIAEADATTIPWTMATPAPPRLRDTILLSQADYVIGDRDLALAFAETRRRSAHAEAAGLQQELNRASAQLAAFRDRWWARIMLRAEAGAHSLRRRLAAVLKRP